MNISRKLFFSLLIGLLALTVLPACSTQPQADLHMLPMDQMPMEVQSDHAEARFNDGVLTLTLPKSESVRPKTIKITSA